MSAAEDFWNIWSERFPVSATHTDGTDALPEGVEFARAGQTVFLSLEELWVLTYGTGFKNLVPEEEVRYVDDGKSLEEIIAEDPELPEVLNPLPGHASEPHEWPCMYFYSGNWSGGGYSGKPLKRAKGTCTCKVDNPQGESA